MKRIEIQEIPDECFTRLMRDVQVTIFKSGVKDIEMFCVENEKGEEVGVDFVCKE